MRIIKSFLGITLLLASGLNVEAQSQSGYVKTRGRLASDGSVIAGNRLSGAFIKVKNRNAVITKADGSFSLLVPKGFFLLEKVEKPGYILSDPETLLKEYECSVNPLILVLESPNQRLADKLQAEKNIRRTLQQKLQEKENKIELLLAQHKIDSIKYQEELQTLFYNQEKDEQLISEMAKRFSTIDYDQLDEFNQKINEHILSGELSKADSLLKTKGDLTTRAKKLKSLQESNDEMQKKLDQSKAYARKELDDIAEDCFNRFQIFRMEHQNDSAGYYLALMADLDSTRVYWQLQAAHYFDVTQADYKRALCYSHKALSASLAKEIANYSEQIACLNSIGQTLYSMGYYDNALSYYSQTMSLIREDSILFEHNYSTLCGNIADVYSSKGDYQKALENYNEAISYCKSDSNGLSTLYNNMGVLYNEIGEYNKALELLEKSLLIDKELGEDNSSVYNNMAMSYQGLGEHFKAVEYYKKALDINIKEYGYIHPVVAKNYTGIGEAYLSLGQNQLALDNQKKALNSARRLIHINHPDLAVLYSNLGGAYKATNNLDSALYYYQKSKDLCEQYSNHYWAKVCTNMGLAYIEKGMVEEGEDLLASVVRHLETDSLPNKKLIALAYNNLGKALATRNENLKAREYYIKAAEILEGTTDRSADDLILIYNNIAMSYVEMNQYNPPIDNESYFGPSYGYILNLNTAFDYFEKCLILLDSINNESHPLYGQIYSNMGFIYSEVENYSEAINCFLVCIEIHSKIGDAKMLAKDHYMLGSLFSRQMEYDQSLIHFQKALDFWKHKEGGNGPSTAAIYEDIGSVYDRKGDHQRAVEYFKKALEYFNQHSGGHEEFVNGLKEYINYYETKK